MSGTGDLFGSSFGGVKSYFMGVSQLLLTTCTLITNAQATNSNQQGAGLLVRPHHHLLLAFFFSCLMLPSSLHWRRLYHLHTAYGPLGTMLPSQASQASGRFRFLNLPLCFRDTARHGNMALLPFGVFYIAAQLIGTRHRAGLSCANRLHWVVNPAHVQVFKQRDNLDSKLPIWQAQSCHGGHYTFNKRYVNTCPC